MRRVAALVAILLTVGVWTASATAAPATTDLPPAPTSVDRVVECAPPPPPPVAVDAGPGATFVSFTLVAVGCAP
jgi:hypothetical protein